MIKSLRTNLPTVWPFPECLVPALLLPTRTVSSNGGEPLAFSGTSHDCSYLFDANPTAWNVFPRFDYQENSYTVFENSV